MKKNIKALLYMALCTLPAGICNAQSGETTSPTTKVEDAPAWFPRAKLNFYSPKELFPLNL